MYCAISFFRSNILLIHIGRNSKRKLISIEIKPTIIAFSIKKNRPKYGETNSIIPHPIKSPKKPVISASAAVKTAARKQNNTDNASHPLATQSSGGCFFSLENNMKQITENKNNKVVTKLPPVISLEA